MLQTISKTIQKSFTGPTGKESLPIFPSSGPGIVDIGTPNLGTFWIVEYVTIVFFEPVGVNRKLDKLAMTPFQLHLSLQEDGFVLIDEVTQLELPFVEPEGTEQTFEAIRVNFQFPQTPRIQPGHHFLLASSISNFTQGIVPHANRFETRLGQISVGYTLVDQHTRARRAVA